MGFGIAASAAAITILWSYRGLTFFYSPSGAQWISAECGDTH